MVATLTTILGAGIDLDGAGVRRWRRCCPAGRLLAVLAGVPLLRALLERLARVTRAVSPATLPAPAAAHHPAHSEAEEGDPEQPEQAEQDQQEPEDPEQAEAAAPVVRAVVVRRAVAGDGVGRQV